MRFDLGHHGQAVLDRLSSMTDHPKHRHIAAQLALLQRAKHKWEWKKPAEPALEPETITRETYVYPPGHTIPADLLSAFNEQSHRYFFNGCSSAHPCDIVAGQWDDDSEFEYVVINGCGHRTTACRNYAIALFNRLISLPRGKKWLQFRLAGDPPRLLRDESAPQPPRRPSQIRRGSVPLPDGWSNTANMRLLG